MAERTYSLQRAAVESLLILEDADAARVLLALELLVEQPDEPPDSSTRDHQGRPFLLRYMGEFIIVYRRNSDGSVVTVFDITRSRR